MSESYGIEKDLDRLALVIGTWLFSAYVSIFQALDNCLFGKTPRYENFAWLAYDNEGQTTTADQFHELYLDNSNYAVLHQIIRYIGSNVQHKYAVHHVNEWRYPYTLRDIFDSPPPPWLLIGYGNPDNLVDCTEFFNCLIAYDNKITSKLLSFMKKLPEETKWYYMDRKTFILTEFPSEGIVIDDDNELPLPESEPEHELPVEKVD